MKCEHKELQRLSEVYVESPTYRCTVCNEILSAGSSEGEKTTNKQYLDSLEVNIKYLESELNSSKKKSEELEGYLNDIETNNNKLVEENTELKTTIRNICKAFGGM